MTFVWRILVVMFLALCATQGAFAHEHATTPMESAAAMQLAPAGGDTTASTAIETAHCADMAAARLPCHHDHSFCCSTSCGAHCGALFVVFRFEPRVAETSVPPPLSEPQRAGVTLEPLLRPPIIG